MAEAAGSRSKTVPIGSLEKSEAIRSAARVAGTRVKELNTFHLEGKPGVLVEPLGSNLIEVSTKK